MHTPAHNTRQQVAAAFTANVWDIKVAVGAVVAKDDTLMVLEAMKMESPVRHRRQAEMLAAGGGW